MEGAPPKTDLGSKSYDRNRKKMAQFLGLDFLFTQREFCQSIQTDVEGRKVLVNSSSKGELLAVKPVPDHLLDKPWFNKKLRFPRNYLGITRVQERVEKLSYLVHILTRYGIPNRRLLKSINRLSMTWYHTRFDDMRKHVKAITLKVAQSNGLTRSPWMSPVKDLSKPPRFSGEKIHENGIVAPLWCRPSFKPGLNPRKEELKHTLNSRS